MKDVYMDDGFIVLACGGDNYDISMERLDTPEKILAWTVHLAQKNWMTKETLVEFVTLALGKYPALK